MVLRFLNLQCLRSASEGTHASKLAKLHVGIIKRWGRGAEVRGRRLSIILFYGPHGCTTEQHKRGILSTASPMEIGATIWHRDFASWVASPMSCFCLMCLPCLKSPCQLEGETLPTWRFTTPRVRSAYSS